MPTPDVVKAAPDVVVVGSLNMDLVVTADRMPRAGETLAGTEFRTVPGGKGANQAVAAARLGASVAMIGRVGGDAFGDALLVTLAHDGVITERVRRGAEAPTGTATILVSGDGENRIVIVAGANARLDPHDVATARDMLASAGAVCLQLEIPLASVTAAAEIARGSGVPVVLNAAPAHALPPALWRAVDYLIVNEHEAEDLTGLAVADPDAARVAARQLRRGGVTAALVTLGAEGAVLSAAGHDIHCPAPRVDVVDTTAAGDAFTAAFTVALTRHWPLETALRFATAAGTLTVTRFGAQPSLPALDDVLRFAAQTHMEMDRVQA